MYLFRWRKRGGGVALMHVYVWEHIVSLSYRTDRWIFTKLGRDEVLMVPYNCCCFLARSIQWRIQGGANIGHRAPSSKKFFFRPGCYLQACGMKCCYFWYHSEVKFLTCFWRLFGLSHFAFLWLAGCIEDLRCFGGFQPYHDLEAGDKKSLKIRVARPGIEPRSSSVASQELNHLATATPALFLCNFYRFLYG